MKQENIKLVDFAKEVREDLRFIRAEVEGFEAMSEALVEVKNTLESIGRTLTSIKDIFANLYKFTISIVNKVLVGIFIIILVAMGAKEIPNLITFFGK